MATRRIKDITNTATTFASDDFIALDGSTQGTRKMDKDDLIAEVSAGVSGDYLEEANNLSDVASLDTSKLNMEIPDVGTAPNEVPLNGQLGTMAYQDANGVSMVNAEVETLEVTGDATVDGTVYMAANKALNMGGASQLYYNNSTLGLQFTGSAGNNTVFIEASSGNVKLSGDETELQFNSDTGVGNNVRARIQCEGKTGTYGYGGDLVFKTTADDNTSTERVRIDSSGRVGIGTASPKGELMVKGTQYIDYGDGGATGGGSLRMSSSAVNGFIASNNYYLSGAYNKFARDGGSSQIQFDTTTGASAGNIIFSTVGSGVADSNVVYGERLRITNTALVMGSGVGIDFGSGATLSDYEEGTHTTAATPSSSGTITLDASSDTLSYTRVGRKVTVSGALGVSAVSSPVGNYINFTLPLQIADLDELSGHFAGSCVVLNAAGSMGSYSIIGLDGESSFRLYKNTSNSAVATAPDFSGDETIYVSVTYFTTA